MPAGTVRKSIHVALVAWDGDGSARQGTWVPPTTRNNKLTTIKIVAHVFGELTYSI